MMSVVLFPTWILLHTAFSVYLLKKTTETYKSKSFLGKLLHVGSFAGAVLCSTIAILYMINGVSAPYWATLAGLCFGINAALGLLFLPLIHHQWVVWKRLLFIGGFFNVACGFAIWMLMFPNKVAFEGFIVSMYLLCFGILSELILFSAPTFLRAMLPELHHKWPFPFNYLHMFCCIGDLPWKDFSVNVCFIRFILLITLYFAYQWMQIDLDVILSLSEKVRITATMVFLTSAWANAISVFAPTMLYRGLMARTAAVVIYVAFGVPIPQLSSLLIVLHPQYFEGSFQERVAQLLYASSLGYLKNPQ